MHVLHFQMKKRYSCKRNFRCISCCKRLPVVASVLGLPDSSMKGCSFGTRHAVKIHIRKKIKLKQMRAVHNKFSQKIKNSRFWKQKLREKRAMLLKKFFKCWQFFYKRKINTKSKTKLSKNQEKEIKSKLFRKDFTPISWVDSNEEYNVITERKTCNITVEDLADKMQKINLSDSSNKSFRGTFHPVDDFRSTLHAAPSLNNDNVDSAVLDPQHTLLPNESVTGQSSEACASNSMSKLAGIVNVSPKSILNYSLIWFRSPSGKKVCFVGKPGQSNYCLLDHSFQTLKPWNLVDGHVIIYHLLALSHFKKVLIMHTDLVKGILNEALLHEINNNNDTLYFLEDSNLKLISLSDLLATDLSAWDAIFGPYFIEASCGGHWNLLAVYPNEREVCLLEPRGSRKEKSESAAQKWKMFFTRLSGEPGVEINENPEAEDADWKGITIDHQVQLSNDFVNCGPIVMHFGFVMMMVLPDIPSYINFYNDELGLDQLRRTYAALILDNSYQVDVNGVFGYDQPSSGGDWSSSCAGGSDVVCATQPQNHLQQVEEAASSVRNFLTVVIRKRHRIISHKRKMFSRFSKGKRKKVALHRNKLSHSRYLLVKLSFFRRPV